jgi:DDE superfamily endonuclease
LKTACLRIADELKKALSRDTLKRALKAAGYCWKRVRRSLKSLRNEDDFRAAQKHLSELRRLCSQVGYDFDLIYFDETGFTLTPCVPYAWQAPKAPLTLPSVHSARLNVLGFLNLRGDFQSFVIEGKVDSEIVIKCFDAYCAQLTNPCLIVLDNAPTHRSEAFEAKIKSWEEGGLYLLFLPPYSPELNLIEILWRKLKYEWLPLSAYESFKELKASLENILKEVGSKYRLSFA